MAFCPSPASPPLVQFVGAVGPAEDPKARLAVAAKHDAVQILDARLVCGMDHLVVAAEHAARAMRQGTNAADSLAVEFLLYASGERQIASAIRKMGIRSDTTEFAVAVLGEGDPDPLLRALRLERADHVLAASPEKLRAFGIPAKEAASVPSGGQADLILERVALVDLWK